jgi:hypothetical protein
VGIGDVRSVRRSILDEKLLGLKGVVRIGRPAEENIGGRVAIFGFDLRLNLARRKTEISAVDVVLFAKSFRNGLEVRLFASSIDCETDVPAAEPIGFGLVEEASDGLRQSA